MQEYNFTIHYLEGRWNVRADALSRREGEEDKRKDNQDVIVLPPELFKRVEILASTERLELLQKFHDSLLAGHPGVKRMKHAMQKEVDWPGMEEDIKEYVKGCQGCQKNKPDRRKRHAPLNPLPIALHPWE